MASRTPPQYSAAFLRHRGFNLVELLIVGTIIGLVLAVLVPAFTSIKTANDLTNVTNGVAGTLERTRRIQNIIAGWIEVALQQAHGSVLPSAPVGSSGVIATIQMDGMKGTVRIYRP